MKESKGKNKKKAKKKSEEEPSEGKKKAKGKVRSSDVEKKLDRIAKELEELPRVGRRLLLWRASAGRRRGPLSRSSSRR